jgi:hypothetical protein
MAIYSKEEEVSPLAKHLPIVSVVTNRTRDHASVIVDAPSTRMRNPPTSSRPTLGA